MNNFAQMQINRLKGKSYPIENNGAGEGIRTLDFNLGNSHAALPQGLFSSVLPLDGIPFSQRVSLLCGDYLACMQINSWLKHLIKSYPLLPLFQPVAFLRNGKQAIGGQSLTQFLSNPRSEE